MEEEYHLNELINLIRAGSKVRGFKGPTATWILSLALCVMLGPLTPFWCQTVLAMEPGLEETDVILDAGHGGIDGGTFYGKIVEKDINLSVAKKTFQALVQKGYGVILNRAGDYALSEHNQWLKSRSRHRKDLAQRMQLANDVQPQVMISLHANWSKRSSSHGPLVLHQNNPNSILLGHLIQTTLNELSGTNEIPVYGKTYFLLNRTKCPTVIVEMGFLSNPQDRRLLTDPDYQTRIAAAIVGAIDKYFEMTGGALQPAMSQH
jgi:N-acetylmuramoyl-L-alanine amidase